MVGTCGNGVNTWPVSLLRYYSAAFVSWRKYDLQTIDGKTRKLFTMHGCLHPKSNPAGTKRPEDVFLWSYFGRDLPDHNRTKIGRIRFLTYFGFVMSGMHLASGNIEKFL